MTDLESFAARLKTLTEGRASTPRVKDGVMTLALDVGGFSAARRDAVADAIREGALLVPGVKDLRIAMTTERRSIRIIRDYYGSRGLGFVNTTPALLHREGGGGPNPLCRQTWPLP